MMFDIQIIHTKQEFYQPNGPGTTGCMRNTEVEQDLLVNTSSIDFIVRGKGSTRATISVRGVEFITTIAEAGRLIDAMHITKEIL